MKKLSEKDAELVFDWLYHGGNTPTILYEEFMHDMPYGTAKARDGDPDNWLADHVKLVEDRFAIDMELEARRRNHER